MNGWAAMLAPKWLAGVTPEVNLRECVTCRPLQSVNKAAHSGFETQRSRHHKSKTGVSVAPQKDFCSPKIKKNNKDVRLFALMACKSLSSVNRRSKHENVQLQREFEHQE